VIIFGVRQSISDHWFALRAKSVTLWKGSLTAKFIYIITCGHQLIFEVIRSMIIDTRANCYDATIKKRESDKGKIQDSDKHSRTTEESSALLLDLKKNTRINTFFRQGVSPKEISTEKIDADEHPDPGATKAERDPYLRL
jgi:hypothetical protein